MPLKPGERLGQYQILELIGTGGMGQVYRARDFTLGREVALKVLAHAGDTDHQRRFPDEARLASSLNHPNIVMIFALGEESDVAYIAMELVRGRTLRALLADGPLPVLKALHLGTQLADALTAAHASGIVHRDLKPDNIMVTAEERVKVLDFGLAKRQGGTVQDASAEVATQTCLTVAGVILGTVGYMAPEQAAGRVVGHAADQFSFGAILYEMLSGRRAGNRGRDSLRHHSRFAPAARNPQPRGDGLAAADCGAVPGEESRGPLSGYRRPGCTTARSAGTLERRGQAQSPGGCRGNCVHAQGAAVYPAPGNLDGRGGGRKFGVGRRHLEAVATRLGNPRLGRVSL